METTAGLEDAKQQLRTPLEPPIFYFLLHAECDYRLGSAEAVIQIKDKLLIPLVKFFSRLAFPRLSPRQLSKIFMPLDLMGLQ